MPQRVHSAHPARRVPPIRNCHIQDLHAKEHQNIRHTNTRCPRSIQKYHHGHRAAGNDDVANLEPRLNYPTLAMELEPYSRSTTCEGKDMAGNKTNTKDYKERTPTHSCSVYRTHLYKVVTMSQLPGQCPYGERPTLHQP